MPDGVGGIVEYVADADRLTLTAGAAITGGNLVKISGADRTVIKTAGTADAGVVGVALFNAAASGDAITVATVGVWPLVAQGSVTRGSDIVSGSVAGSCATLAVASTNTTAEINNARNIVGIALEAISDTATGRVKLRRL